MTVSSVLSLLLETADTLALLCVHVCNCIVYTGLVRSYALERCCHCQMRDLTGQDSYRRAPRARGTGTGRGTAPLVMRCSAARCSACARALLVLARAGGRHVREGRALAGHHRAGHPRRSHSRHGAPHPYRLPLLLPPPNPRASTLFVCSLHSALSTALQLIAALDQ